ncbi:DUF84 family protein [Kurthia sibirica]|uniref:inosine/xanthosine triphosphatase n=1 Tax=Kurthia sibirica TaxID=202750 RepID=A0A2U3ANX4_9BACL|nr:DUF84 family protein [Kurthia sibirica]PWI26248.1 DUF84 domain-containing protein [Kurthia sibirica]GEK33862.1 NTPase [Kurthia sibirica]
MLVAIGTKNKAKIQAVKVACNRAELQETIDFVTYDVASLVSAQPFSDEETCLGAINRAQAALKKGNATIGIGLEGGVKWQGKQLYLCNWAALATKDQVFTAAGAQIPLPLDITQQLLMGVELGPIMDAYAQQEDVRQHAGAIGIFTDGLIDRSEMFEHTVLMLLGQYRYNLKQ